MDILFSWYAAAGDYNDTVIFNIAYVDADEEVMSYADFVNAELGSKVVVETYVQANSDGGYFTTPPLVADMVLEFFYKESEPESSISESFVFQSSDIKPAVTGDSTNIFALAMFLIFIVSAVLITLTCKRNQG